MKIHNIDATGSFTYNGVDLSNLTGSTSDSGSFSTQILNLNQVSSSLNSFTSSINTTIKSKLDSESVISGSIQVSITGTTGYSTFSSSVSSSIGSLSGSVATTTSGLSSSIGSLSSSVATTTSDLSSSIGSLSSSVATTTGNLSSRIGSVETKTGSYATTGSNIFVGSQVITGSLYITNDMVVQGCSCLQNITASAVSIGTNTVVLNTATPAVRFAGISVQDSGSNAGVTGSIYWDGLCNRWVYSNPSGIGYSGGMLLSGPRTSTLGSEAPLTCNYIAKSGGGDHLYDSCIIDDGTTVCINATLKANGQVCGLMGTFSCVGISTTTPSTKLDVYAGADATSNLVLWGQTIRNEGNGAATGYGAGLKLKISSNDATNEVYKWAGIAAVAGTNYSNRTDLVLYSNAASTVDAIEKVRITGDGYVGINTCTPSNLLHIEASNNTTNQFRVNSCDGLNAGLRSYTVCDGAGLIINHYYAVSGNPYLRTSDFVSNQGDAAATQMRFFTKDVNVNAALAMIITSGGKVGIGTTLPGLNLSAQGLYGLPNTSGTQTVGIFRVQDSASNIALDMGVVQNVATWIQSGNKANSEVLPLTLNPSGGNVGIGVTPSVWRSSERALQIGPTTTLYDVFGITILGNNFYTNTSSQSIYSTCGYASYYWQNTSDGSHVWTTAPSAAAGSVISFCERMRITCGGTIGIGTTTPKTYSSLTTQGQLISLNNIGIDYGQSFRLNNYYNSGTGTDRTISSGYAASIGLDQSGGAMVFQMSTTCVAGDNNITTKERIRLTCNGTVLINNSGGYVDYSRVTISGTCNKNQTPGVGGSILHLTSCETDYPFGIKFNIVGDTCNCLRSVQIQTGDHGLTNQGNVTFQHAGGSILMGTSTSSGIGILNTYKAPVSSNYVDQIVVQGTGNYPSLRLGTYDAYDAVIATTGNDLRILSGLNVYTENHDIMFYTSFNGGTGGAQCYERMRVRYDGNVGIGTASPSAKLQVAGTIYNSATAGGSNYTLDTMGAYQSIANGGFVDFGGMSGMILVNNWLNGGVTLYLVGGGNTAALGSVVNVVGTMHHSPGVGGYRWCNNYGSTANFGFQVFRTRNTA